VKIQNSLLNLCENIKESITPYLASHLQNPSGVLSFALIYQGLFGGFSFLFFEAEFIFTSKAVKICSGNLRIILFVRQLEAKW
jgi:hypothetical protein